MNKVQEQIANKMAVPVILKLLKPFKASDMMYAISNNVSLSQGLQDDPEYLRKIRMLTVGIPFVNQVGDAIKKKSWILWFLNGSMKKKRPDLYNQIIYNPKGEKYILKEIKHLVSIIFD